jgi:hypothetical protein
MARQNLTTKIAVNPYTNLPEGVIAFSFNYKIYSLDASPMVRLLSTRFFADLSFI